LECTIFLVRRLRSGTVDHAVLLVTDQLNGTESAKQLVGEQFERVWDELAAHRLKVQPEVAAKLMAQALTSLERIDRGAFMMLSFCVLWAFVNT
jgi:hypothetical protein